MDSKYNALFTPWKIGKVEIPNRIVQCSMGGTSLFGWMEPCHLDKEAAYFLLNRAKDGVGLILPGMQCIKDAIGGRWLYQNDKMFKDLKVYMEEFHKTGAKLFVQLAAGMGRSMAITKPMVMLLEHPLLGKLVSPVADLDYITASASATPNRWYDEVKSRPMTIKEIQDQVEAFAKTSKKLMDAGVDGVEIHAVHEGYLLDQFTISNMNYRTDQYGGSFENRFRFPVEIVQAIKAACGPDFPVSLRYSVVSKTKDWGKETPVSSRAWNILPGNDVYAYFFMDNGNIFGERRDNGDVEKVVDWMACDVDSNTIDSDRFGFLSDGRIVAVTYEYADNGPSKQQILVLNRVDAASVQTKTELTLACLYLDYNLRSQIVRFNKTNPDYRIVVKDYSEYATDDDSNAGLTKLNTEIISGNVPDIIANETGLPLAQYASKGLLEDLWPYIDADPEYSRDKLMAQPLNAAQTEGKLYRLPLDFGVTTAVGLGKVVGEYTTWTLADVNNALSKLPEGATVFNKYYTQAEMLQYCVAMNADSFMNWQDGTCSFDSDEFRALLEFVKPFPTDYDWQSDSEDYESDYTSLKNGKQLLYPTSLSGFSDLYYTFAALNNDIRFVGFPREDGSSGNAFNASCTLSISTTCKDKSGAWAFIRSTLSDDYQKNLWNYPIVKSVFEAKAQEAMTQEYETDADGNQILDDDGNPIPISNGGMSYGDEPMIELYAVTQEQYDAVMALIDSTTSFVDYDQNVLSIISDEAAGYFAGSKTVEEASKLIQSRVGLYMQEQK